MFSATTGSLPVVTSVPLGRRNICRATVGGNYPRGGGWAIFTYLHLSLPRAPDRPPYLRIVQNEIVFLTRMLLNFGNDRVRILGGYFPLAIHSGVGASKSKLFLIGRCAIHVEILLFRPCKLRDGNGRDCDCGLDGGRTLGGYKSDNVQAGRLFEECFIFSHCA
jgi:hypothetical protein